MRQSERMLYGAAVPLAASVVGGIGVCVALVLTAERPARYASALHTLPLLSDCQLREPSRSVFNASLFAGSPLAALSVWLFANAMRTGAAGMKEKQRGVELLPTRLGLGLGLSSLLSLRHAVNIVLGAGWLCTAVFVATTIVDVSVSGKAHNMLSVAGWLSFLVFGALATVLTAYRLVETGWWATAVHRGYLRGTDRSSSGDGGGGEARGGRRRRRGGRRNNGGASAEPGMFGGAQSAAEQLFMCAMKFPCFKHVSVSRTLASFSQQSTSASLWIKTWLCVVMLCMALLFPALMILTVPPPPAQLTASTPAAITPTENQHATLVDTPSGLPASPSLPDGTSAGGRTPDPGEGDWTLGQMADRFYQYSQLNPHEKHVAEHYARVLGNVRPVFEYTIVEVIWVFVGSFALDIVAAVAWKRSQAFMAPIRAGGGSSSSGSSARRRRHRRRRHRRRRRRHEDEEAGPGEDDSSGEDPDDSSSTSSNGSDEDIEDDVDDESAEEVSDGDAGNVEDSGGDESDDEQDPFLAGGSTTSRSHGRTARQRQIQREKRMIERLYLVRQRVWRVLFAVSVIIPALCLYTWYCASVAVRAEGLS